MDDTRSEVIYGRRQLHKTTSGKQQAEQLLWHSNKPHESIETAQSEHRDLPLSGARLHQFRFEQVALIGQHQSLNITANERPRPRPFSPHQNITSLVGIFS